MQVAAGRHYSRSQPHLLNHDHICNHRQINPTHVSLTTGWSIQRIRHCNAAGPRARHRMVAKAIGPEPYDDSTRPNRRLRKPEWVRILEEDADNDPEVARLLEGTDGDPDRIRDKMKFALKETDIRREQQGSDVPPVIKFRAISPLGLWVWLEFLEAPLSGEQELLEGILKSWFAVGKLGGYNSQNLQVYQNADDDQSFFDYDNDEVEAGENRMSSYIHDIGEVEYQGKWARVWIDMGTADELALDVLLNMLVGFSSEMCGLKSVLLGGVNEDWPVPDEEREFGPDDDYMKVGMNPMRLPEGLDEEFQFMDDEGMFEGAKGRRSASPTTSREFDGYGSNEGEAGVSSSTGYGIRAGSYGARAEEQELQRLAERLRSSRRPSATTARGGKGEAGKTGGYYGAGALGDRDLALGWDFNPDELEFTDENERVEGRGAGGGNEAGYQQGADAKRPWGASFVRRLRREESAGGNGHAS